MSFSSMSESWSVTGRICVLNGTYVAEDNKTVLLLFGVTEQGESIVIRYDKHLPYCYIAKPADTLPNNKMTIIEWLNTQRDVLKVEECTLTESGGAEIKCLKVTVRYPFIVSALRKELPESTFYSADIPYVNRVYYDLDLGPFVAVKGKLLPELKTKYVADVVLEAESIQSCEPFTPKLSTMAIDIETSLSQENLYCIACSFRSREGNIRTEKISGETSFVLRTLLSKIRQHNPDIICGYNLNNFDLPRLLEFAGQLGLELKMGRDWTAPEQIHTLSRQLYWRLHGRILVDVWLAVKYEKRPRRETLGYVSETLLGLKKGDIIPANMDREWLENPDKVKDYCSRDSELTLWLLETLRIVEKGIALATVSKLPLDSGINGRSSERIDSLLIREADKRGIAVPLNRHSEEKTSRITGAYVHTPKVGLFSWVIICDVSSTYPTCIQKYNICFTTLSEAGTITCPTGSRFLSPSVKKGILPQILEDLLKKRKEIKELMKSCEPNKKEFYDRLQNALKIQANSNYGVFASAFYRFTNKSIGQAITAYAREIIKNIIKSIEDQGYTVLAGDTDSCIIQSPYKNLEQSIEFGKMISEQFSKEGVQFVFEKILQTYLSYGKKKHYIGKSVYPTEELLTRGIESRRSDVCPLLIKTQNTVVGLILENNVPTALQTSKDVIRGVKKGLIPIEDLVISRSCRSEEEYVKPNQLATVQAVRKLEAEGGFHTSYAKVSYIVTDARKVPMVVEPYIEGSEFKHKIDYDYYVKRVAKMLSRVTEVFGLDEKSLLLDSTQQTIDKWM